MKIFLLFCVLSFSGAAMAQGWSVLNNEFLELYNKEEFNKAAVIGEKAKLAAKKEFGEGHANYATSLYNLASVYLEMAQYKKAEPLYVLAKTIQQKVLGEDHADYASTISDLATLYVETKQYSKAEPLYLQAKKISASTNGISNAEYITIVENLGLLYEEMKLYDKAELLLVEANLFYKNHPGENKTDYESSLNGLAGLYDKMGKYAGAQTYYLLLANLLKQEVGEVSKEYAKVINRIALLYTEMGEYEKAEPLYFDNAAIRKIVYGEIHPDYASALSNIASHYIDLGQYEKAMSFYMEAVAIAEQNSDKTNTDYITYVNNVALLYMQMGKYDIAEPLFGKLVEVKKKIVGENHPSYAMSLNNLGAIYFKTGQFEKAVPVYTRALAIIKKSIGELTPDYASALNNLALLYATMGQLTKAEPLYLQCKTIREKLQLQNHPDYAALSDNLGLLYSAMGKPAKTKALYIQAKNIRRKLFGEEHPDYAVSLNNLGYYYMEEMQYDSAEVLFIQAKDIMKKRLGEQHPAYGAALNNLSDLYIRTGQYQKAEPGLLQSGKIVLEQIRTTFTVLSESEKNNFLKNNKAFFETSNNFLLRYKQASMDTRINIFNCQLVLKSASLTDTRNMMDLLLNSPDSSIRKLFSAWTSNRNILARQYALPESNRRNDLKKIESDTEEQEKELNMRSAEFQNQQAALQNVMADVQKNLQPAEVAIEFVRFQLTGTDSILYAAYIVHPDVAVPDFVPLCGERQLELLFDQAGKTSTRMVSSFYRGIDINNTNHGVAGKELYRLIWQPLTPYLKGVKKISYAPAGKLYNVAFHALPVDSTTILLDNFALQQYTSIRELAFRRPGISSATPGSITLFGNASFTMDSLQIAKQKNNHPQKKTISTSVYTPLTRGGDRNVWASLPGTAEELSKIKLLFEKEQMSATTFVQTAASEENLKALSGDSPPILHIATHGFFLPDPAIKKAANKIGGNTFMVAEDPLLRSGLLLAGANYAWAGKRPVPGAEDGIATAYEIAQLNLSKTELVVLSACETALGDVKESEGVFGLQRAFKMAGVKKMIVSLWQVPDKETAELMTTFYTYWMNGKIINEAFAQAQADMRKKYVPFYWAAFVLVE